MNGKISLLIGEIEKSLDQLARLEEYDFSGGVRGKYSKRYEQGSNVVVITTAKV